MAGYAEDDDDLRKIYVGEGDGVKDRITSHVKTKEFWDWCVTFVSTDRSLNKAHIQWLEYALVKQAKLAGRSSVENGNTPQEPALGEGEKAYMQAFLKNILQILPLIDLRAFEMPKAVEVQKKTKPISATVSADDESEVIIVPAQEEGFQRVFLGENKWHAIRIGEANLPKIKYIAAYQSRPISAITYIAPVARIEPYGDQGKYQLIFSEPARKLDKPKPFGNAPSGIMQGPKYTSYKKFQESSTVAELLVKAKAKAA